MSTMGKKAPALEITSTEPSETYISVGSWLHYLDIIDQFNASLLMTHIQKLRIVVVQYDRDKAENIIIDVLHVWERKPEKDDTEEPKSINLDDVGER